MATAAMRCKSLKIYNKRLNSFAVTTDLNLYFMSIEAKHTEYSISSAAPLAVSISCDTAAAAAFFGDLNYSNMCESG